MFDELMRNLIGEYKKSPRNKLFIDENLLLASVKEEMGEETSAENLREIINNFLDGKLNEEEERIYDAAVYSCGVAARTCLGNDPDKDVDYELEWILNSDDSYTAEIILC